MPVTDADRERAVRELSRHCGDGRLTLDELEDRITEVYAATTEAELALAFRELPPFRLPSRDAIRPAAWTAPAASVPATDAPGRTRPAAAGGCGLGGLQHPPIERVLRTVLPHVRQRDVLVARA